MSARYLAVVSTLFIAAAGCGEDDTGGAGGGVVVTGGSGGTGTGSGVGGTGTGGTGTGGTGTGTAGTGGGAGSSEGFACQYPGDVSIDSHGSVVWYEGFEQGSVGAVVARYESTSNEQRMALEADVPAHSPGSASLRMTAGGGTNDTDLYKNFVTGWDELYLRYYVKYQDGVDWHHTGVHVGGYFPDSNWPQGGAGVRPNGDDRFSVAFEPVQNGTNPRFDFYNYWMGMQDSPGGSYWGNTLIHDTRVYATHDWQCVELHIRMNTDTGSNAGAELGIWLDDVSYVQYDDQGPVGRWLHDKFCRDTPNTSPSCTDYFPLDPPDVVLDLQWRTTTDLKINYFWPQNYITAANTGDVWFDDIVIATERVGCICPPS
ncbi:MAG: hypothetical protein JRI23_10025 [Deltaproteobacteria bacterium]|jgi:hypothetical protein|nr:hypothetical protein [Deltaproteobacteria bacterium]MBW2532009.1 hypothetical protein [Deltaproteobacteria bacterium]